ncbi:MAG: phosphonoacetaldehyde reductase [Ruminococcus sp.]|nr:phosphonoacetaldehyde reductase [Ruminococcus sp.]
MKKQLIFRGSDAYSAFEEYLISSGRKKILAVYGESLSESSAGRFFSSLTAHTGIEVVRFSGFTPNPDYSEIVTGVRLFRSSGCDMICCAGGGSAMDTGKCIKLFADMPDGKEFFRQEIVQNDIPLSVIPSTAGTGSETTRYAVIYHNNVKISVTHESCVPSAVLFDPSLLDTLPAMHKKSAMLDALCHGIESFWSVNSTPVSRELSKQAITTVLHSMDGYISGDRSCAELMLAAANTAGKAIDITATTAGHAMCYKLTSLYHIPHGHAAALCVPQVYRFMLDSTERCCDKRGSEYLTDTLHQLAFLLGTDSPQHAFAFLESLPSQLGLHSPSDVSDDDIHLLSVSFNPERLRNNPVIPDTDDLYRMYRHILCRKTEYT